ncbi:MAG: calcium-translocating P-type ATPase, SERCA-type [Thermacetogeniaceae bacterium]|jgi:Ca2+-transporting ATPase
MKGQKWYVMDLGKIGEILGTDLHQGLSPEEAERRLGEYGPNVLKEPPPRSIFSMFIDQIKEVLVLILIAAAVISGLVGEWADSLVIMIIVMLNACLGVYQEHKAEEALKALKKMTKPVAKVIRAGSTCEVNVESLVPGDIVLLEAGDSLPADIRLTETISMQTNEAALTGESVPVEKDTAPLEKENVGIGDRKNMGFMGTTVTTGRGRGIVVATGMSTELGKIAELIQATPPESTPLQRRLGELGKYMGIIAGVIVLIVFLTGLLRGEELLGMFMIAISLAVAAVPEGLPAVVTIVLAMGVTKMSRRRAVVRRLPAVETLGTVTVICSDKTGTLTKNEMTVTRLYTDGQNFEVTGVGYEPEGEFIDDQGNAIEPLSNQNLMFMLMGGLLCTDAEMKKADDNWRVIGDPTEGALVVAAAKTGLRKTELERESPRLAEIPFDSGRKMMTTFNRINDKIYSFTKGAPDLLVARCSSILKGTGFEPLSEEDRKQLLKINSRWASQGERVLALAIREWKEVPEKPKADQVENDMTFVGYFSMIDPARPEVKEAVDVGKGAGIRTVMITGDHRDTAVAIARELGIWHEGDNAVSGEQLQKMDDQELKRVVLNTTVFARVSPEDKLRIVTALKEHKHVVAMTGDGVNDAPALKRADIGVSMGITGTEVAKEASSMVLMDDNYATIVSAVEEGRTIYSNIRKSIHYLLSCNIGEIITIFSSILVGVGSPLTAIQILWLNLVTDGLPALALGVEPAEKDVMKQPPRKPDEGVFAGGMGVKIVWQGIVIGLLALAVYLLALRWGRTLPEAHTMTFATMALMQLVHSFNARSMEHSIFNLGIASNRSLIFAFFASAAITAAVIFVPFLREFFDTALLRVSDWFVVFGFALIPLIIVEISKMIKGERVAVRESQ